MIGGFKMDKEEKAQDQKKKSSGILIKILVPAVIVIAVAGIFIFKNPPRGEEDKGMASVTPERSDVIQTDAAVDYGSSEFDLDATQDFDLNKVLSYGMPVIVDFGSDTCIPCQKMAPVLKELNEELRGKAVVKFVDIGKNQAAAADVPLSVIPTQFFFDKDGKPYVLSEPKENFVMYSTRDTNEHVFTAHMGYLGKEDILAVLKEMGME